MDWTPLSLNTLTTQVPKIYNDNFTAFKRYLDVFYDEDLGVVVVPVNTTGRVKAATGQFVNVVVDNLTVKKQFTNLLDNYTVVDSAFITALNGEDISTRISNSDPSTSIWPLEPSTYSWVDVQEANIKINNDASYGFQNDVIGQEFRLIFTDTPTTSNDFNILLDASEGGELNLTVTVGDAPEVWVKLITSAWDASYGPKWIIKEYGGTITIA